MKVKIINGNNVGIILDVSDFDEDLYKIINNENLIFKDVCEIIQETDENNIPLTSVNAPMPEIKTPKESEDDNMNKMKDVALMLGLKWDDEKGESEEFNINSITANISPYTITNVGIIDALGKSRECFLSPILRGKYTIKKIPKKISFAEAYKANYARLGERHKKVKSLYNDEIFNEATLCYASARQTDGEWEVVE